MASAQSLSMRAQTLAQQGRVQEAVQLLAGPGAAQDAEAQFTLALWALEGRLIARNLAASREYFRRAATIGHLDAFQIFINFLANGTGGPRDWGQALELLKALAAHDDAARQQLDMLAGIDLTAEGDPAEVPEGRVLSSSPDVRYFDGFWTAAECDYLTAFATPLLQPAVVIDPATGREITKPIRTSDTMGIPLTSENPVIHALNRRLAAASGTLASQGEPLQVLRYAPGQEYRPHSDALPQTGNQRVLTMLVYLNDEYEGGETAFLKTDLKVKGRKGDALLFRNTLADKRADPMAQHAGLPVTAGVKWLASRWIRERPIDLSKPIASL